MTSKVLDWQRLLEQSALWAQVAACEESEIDNFMRTNPDGSIVARVIRGKRCRTTRSLFQEWAAALQFPYYFGENWDAFEECISDLQWLPATGYIFLVTNADLVLQDSELEYRVFIGVLDKAARQWMNPPHRREDNKRTALPFRIVFHCEPASEERTRMLLSYAGLAIE